VSFKLKTNNKIIQIIGAMLLWFVGLLIKANMGSSHKLFSKENFLEASIVTLVGIIVACVVISLRSKSKKNK